MYRKIKGESLSDLVINKDFYLWYQSVIHLKKEKKKKGLFVLDNEKTIHSFGKNIFKSVRLIKIISRIYKKYLQFKNKNNLKKMEKDFEQTPYQRRYTHGI